MDEWSVYARNRKNPLLAMGYSTPTMPTNREIEEYREMHDLPETEWEITVSKVEE